MSSSIKCVPIESITLGLKPLGKMTPRRVNLSIVCVPNLDVQLGVSLESWLSDTCPRDSEIQAWVWEIPLKIIKGHTKLS